MFRISAAAALLLASIPAVAEPAAQNLEQRVQRIEDELAIRRVITDYAVTLDSRDFDAYVSLFARDGIWQTGNTMKKGRAEIRAMLDGLYGQQEPEPFGYQRFRIVSNIEINLDGDRATARSRHLSIQRGEKGAPTPSLAGLYVDEFIREDGEWKILHRTDYPIMPTAEEWRVQMEELRAKRGQ